MKTLRDSMAKLMHDIRSLAVLEGRKEWSTIADFEHVDRLEAEACRDAAGRVFDLLEGFLKNQKEAV